MGKLSLLLVNRCIINSMIKRCESIPYTPPNHKYKKKKTNKK